MTILIPESIQTTTTSSLDETFEARLALLDLDALISTLAKYDDVKLLDFLMQMYGVPLDLLSLRSMTQKQREVFFKQIITIRRHSGTRTSIELLAMLLGATKVRIEHTWALRYDGEACYDGAYHFDAGEEYKRFAVTVAVSGVADFTAFEKKFRSAFKVFEPARLYLYEVILE